MPITSTTGTTIPDDFFSPVTTPVSDESMPAQGGEKPNLPKDDPGWQQLENYLINGEIPPGREVQVVRTRRCTYNRPADPFSPESVIPPNCEVYKFVRKCQVELRKYLVVTPSYRLLFHVSVEPFEDYVWVLFCREQPPQVLHVSREDKFADTPPPLMPPYHWRPPLEIGVSYGDFMAGWYGPQPDQLKPIEPDYFYEVKCVYILELPTRYEGCIVVATYRRAFRVTRTHRTTGAKQTYDVKLEGTVERRYEIPDCPQPAQGAWKLENPRRVAQGLVADGAIAVQVDTGNGEWVTAKLSAGEPHQPDRVRLSGDVAGLISNAPAVRIRAIVKRAELAKETNLNSEWGAYALRSNPACVLAEFAGSAHLGADGSGYMEFEAAHVLAAFRHGIWVGS